MRESKNILLLHICKQSKSIRMLMHERFKQQSVLHNMPFVTLMFTLGEIRHYNIISICSIDMITPHLSILFNTMYSLYSDYSYKIYILLSSLPLIMFKKYSWWKRGNNIGLRLKTWQMYFCTYVLISPTTLSVASCTPYSIISCEHSIDKIKKLRSFV